MNKNEFINKLKEIEKIDNWNKIIHLTKELLLEQTPYYREAFITNEYACNEEEFILDNFKSSISKANQTINFKNVLGGGHSDYKNQSPVQMILNGAKRMDRVFYYLATNPEYFFGSENQKQGDPISYIAYTPKDKQEQYYIADQGNHRTAMGRFLKSFFPFDNELIKIDNVFISEYFIDWELLDKIKQTNEVLSKYGYSVYTEKINLYTNSIDYSLINRIAIHNKERIAYIGFQHFNYQKGSIKKDINENDKLILKYLDNAVSLVPKSEKLIFELIQIKNAIVELIKLVKKSK